MKKITAILIMIIYLIPALGFSINAHYCGDKLASVSFDLLNSEKCACGSKKMKSKCCKTKSFSLKIEDSQKQTPQLLIEYDKVFKAHAGIVTIPFIGYYKVSQNSFSNHHHPPNKPKLQLYLTFQVFRL